MFRCLCQKMYHNLYQTKNDEEWDKKGSRGEELDWTFFNGNFFFNLNGLLADAVKTKYVR